MPRASYLEREAEVRACLDRRAVDYRIPRYYGDKPDFGDMDVLVAAGPEHTSLRAELPRASSSAPGLAPPAGTESQSDAALPPEVTLRSSLRTYLARELGIEQSKNIGHVWSVLYRDLQTDFFSVQADRLESTYAFMSFNDAGNLIGRICRRFDLKYGEAGLSYVYRRARGGYARDLLVTRDFARICAFLGLDHAAWAAGFATLADVFDFVVASPYFSVAPYFDPTGTLAKRQQRPTIARFVEHLRARGIDRRPELGDRREQLARIAAAFPHARLEEQIAAEREKEERAEAIARKLDGELVMRLRPELRGRALGRFFVALKTSVPDFEEWVLRSSDAEIEAHVRALEPADETLNRSRDA